MGFPSKLSTYMVHGIQLYFSIALEDVNAYTSPSVKIYSNTLVITPFTAN